MTSKHYLATGISGIVLVSGFAAAAEALTDAGKALEARYSSAQAALKAEIEKALPQLDDAKIAAWQQAILAEEGPAKELATRMAEVTKLQGAGERLRKMEENLKYGPQARLLGSSESFLASRQKEIDQLQKSIGQAKQEVEDAKVKLPGAIQALEAARKAHDKVLSATWQAIPGQKTVFSNGSPWRSASPTRSPC